jgi:hypothetical protein
LADFADKRRQALDKLRAELRETQLDQLTDDQLAMHAILEMLFRDARTTVDVAKAEAVRLATQQLPSPSAGRRKRLSATRRDDILLTVGRMWEVFTAHNFPLQPNQKNGD